MLIRWEKMAAKKKEAKEATWKTKPKDSNPAGESYQEKDFN